MLLEPEVAYITTVTRQSCVYSFNEGSKQESECALRIEIASLTLWRLPFVWFIYKMQLLPDWEGSRPTYTISNISLLLLCVQITPVNCENLTTHKCTVRKNEKSRNAKASIVYC